MFDGKNLPVELIGTSHDLGEMDDVYPAYRQIAHIAEQIHARYSENICVADLAAGAICRFRELNDCSTKFFTIRLDT